VTITSGSSEPNNDFGNFQQGTKSGVKFNDLNGNGTKDAGEPGLNGWVIRAYTDTNGDGVLQATETTFVSQTTATVAGVDGVYSFSLNPGKYVVCEVLQATWTQSRPSGNTKCSAVSGLGAAGFAVTITSGSSEPNNDFGNFQQATIAGTKFKDINNNGVKDVGEPGAQGWVIHIYNDAGGSSGSLDATDALVDTQTTDANGNYTSKSLNAGTYYVCEVGQTNWNQTYPTAATLGSTSCAAKDGGRGWKITLAGVNATVNDFGNTPLSHITVNFFSDATLSGGGDATQATSITCTDSGTNPLADQDSDSTDNDYVSPKVTLDKSKLTCVIEFVDP